MKIFKLILGEIGTLLIALVSICLILPWFWIWDCIPVGLISIGVLYTLLKPLYDYRKRPWKERWRRMGKWALNFLYQIWNVVKYVFIAIGYIIDLFGNVTLGELIEDLVTDTEFTLFGEWDVTISAALGDLKRRNAFRKSTIFGKEICIGLWFCNVLSKLDPKHEDHCISAIELYDFKQSQK